MRSTFGTTTTPSFGSGAFGSTGFGNQNNRPNPSTGFMQQQQQQTSGFGTSATPAFGSSGSTSFGTAGTASPFGQRSAFGSVPQPTTGVSFGGNTGVNTGFGGNTGFGAKPASPGTAFGASSGLGSPFGKPTTAFGSGPTAFGGAPASTGFSTPFSGGNTAFGAPQQQQQQPSFGFGASNAPATQPAFGSGAPAFGSAAPAFGAPAPAFGSANTGFGSGGNAFGSQPAFGAPAATPFGTSAAAPAFGSPSTAFGGGNTGFGSAAPNAFGGGGTFGQGQQNVGTAGFQFTPLQVKESVTKNGITNNLTLKLQAITGIPQFESKSQEELRWEDYQRGQKTSNPAAGGMGAGAFSGFGSAAPTNAGFQSTGFGQPNTQPQAPMFGSTAAPAFGTSPFAPSTGFAPPATGFGFGQQPQQSAMSRPMTGFSPTPAAPSMFGGAHAPTSTFGTPQPAPSTGLSFAQPNNAFGQANNAFNQPKPATAFGTPGAGGFGSTVGGFGGFGSTAQPAPTSSLTGGFGATTTPGFGGFGKPATAIGAPSFGGSAFPMNPQPNTMAAAPSYFPNNNAFAPNTQSTATFQGLNMIPNAASYAPKPDLRQKIEYLKKKKSDLEIHLNQDQSNDSNKEAGNNNKSKKSMAEELQSQLQDDSMKKLFPSNRMLKKSSAKILPRGYHVPSTSNRPSTTPAIEPPPSLKQDHHIRRLIVVPTTSSSHHISSVPPLHQHESYSSSSTSHNDHAHVSDAGWMTPHAKESTSTPRHPQIDEEKTGLTPGDALATPHSSLTPPRNSFHVADTLPRPPSFSPSTTSHRSPAHSRGPPQLSRAEYGTIPDMKVLTSLSDDELSHLRSFTIYHRTWGEIHWGVDNDDDASLDIRGMDLDDIVHIDHEEVSVYEDSPITPPVGQGLNRPATVTLHHILPAMTSPSADKGGDAIMISYEAKLRRFCADHNAQFIAYDHKNGTWTFRVQHFSRYSIKNLSEDGQQQASSANTSCDASNTVNQSLHPDLQQTFAMPPESSSSTRQLKVSGVMHPSSNEDDDASSEMKANMNHRKYDPMLPSALQVHSLECKYKPHLLLRRKRKSSLLSDSNLLSSHYAPVHAQAPVIQVYKPSATHQIAPLNMKTACDDMSYQSKHFIPRRINLISLSPASLITSTALPPNTSHLLHRVQQEYAATIGVDVDHDDHSSTITRIIPASARPPRPQPMRTFLPRSAGFRTSFNSLGHVVTFQPHSHTHLHVYATQLPTASQTNNLSHLMHQLHQHAIFKESRNDIHESRYSWHLPRYHPIEQRPSYHAALRDLLMYLQHSSENDNDVDGNQYHRIRQCVELFDIFYGEQNNRTLHPESISHTRFMCNYPCIDEWLSKDDNNTRSDDAEQQIFLRVCQGDYDQAIAIAEDENKFPLALLLTQMQGDNRRDRTIQHLCNYQLDVWMQQEGRLSHDMMSTALYRLLAGDIYPSAFHPTPLFQALPSAQLTWKYIFGMIYFQVNSSLSEAMEIFHDAMESCYFPNSAVNLYGKASRAPDAMFSVLQWLASYQHRDSASHLELFYRALDPVGYECDVLDFAGVYVVWLCLESVASSYATSTAGHIISQHFLSQLLAHGLIKEAFLLAMQIPDARVRDNTIRFLSLRYYPFVSEHDLQSNDNVWKMVPAAWKQESSFCFHRASCQEHLALMHLGWRRSSSSDKYYQEQVVKKVLWKWIRAADADVDTDKHMEHCLAIIQHVSTYFPDSEDIKRVSEYLLQRQRVQKEGGKNETVWLQMQSLLHEATAALLRGQRL